MDYGDVPINTPVARRKASALCQRVANRFRRFDGVECIHGHFLVSKYLPLAKRKDGVRFITWMRDPIERLASHYHYWQRSYDPATAAALHKRVVEEEWSFDRFCLGDELKDLYSQFLWGFPFERFDFIGIVEEFDTEFEYFSREYLSGDGIAISENINPDKEHASYVPDATLRKRIESHHARDMILYQMALEKRAKRSQ